jgi:hypothetical protein
MAIYERSFAGPLLHLFDFDRFPPSVERLPAALTINGITVLPTFRYKGGDANAVNWPAWGYGETLTLQAGTAPTLNNGSPLLGQMDDSVKFNGGGNYRATGTTGQITTEDFVVEAMFTWAGTATLRLMDKWSATGWLLVAQATTAIEIYFNDGGGIAVEVISGVLVAGVTYHLIAFLDRSGSGQIYINGVASGSPVAISGRANSLATAALFDIGADSNGTSLPYTSNIHYLAMWQGASWLDTHLQATIAATRFAQLTGMYPQQARGTALPITMARSTAGYIDKREADGTTKLYYVGANWPRSCSRLSGSRIVKGYLSETSAQNVCLQSQVLGTTWTPTGVVAGDNSWIAPDGTLTGDAITEDDSNGQHRYSLNLATTAAPWVFSCYCKASKRSHIILQSNADGGYKFGYFNIGNGTVLSVSTPWTAGVESLGNGVYRVYMTTTALAQVSFFSVQVSDSTLSYQGDSVNYSPGIYVWGIQLELGKYPSSYIPTTTAPVTRTADNLTYVGTGNIITARGTIAFDVMAPNAAFVTQETYVTIPGTSGGVIRIDTNYGGISNELELIGGSGSVYSGAITIKDGIAHALRGTWQTDSVILYRDGVSVGTPAISNTPPTDPPTTIYIGQNNANLLQANALITNLRFFGVPTLKR